MSSRDAQTVCLRPASPDSLVLLASCGGPDNRGHILPYWRPRAVLLNLDPKFMKRNHGHQSSLSK